ncbi:MAG: hypothetical protein QM769_02060 [Pseudoxanthomonas sp.]
MKNDERKGYATDPSATVSGRMATSSGIAAPARLAQLARQAFTTRTDAEGPDATFADDPGWPSNWILTIRSNASSAIMN